MTGFSATDAALEGFRITRERPKALMAWTAFCFAYNALNVLITVNLPAEVRAALNWIETDPGQAPDPQVLASALTLLSPLLVFGLAVQCVMAAAVYRIILRPGDEKFSYLRLGKDELRLMALTLIYVMLVVVFVAAGTLAVGIVAFVASFFGQSALAFVFAVAELFVLGLLFYVGVRMSLAPVVTFDRNRLAIFDSWAITEGQFWRLLGAYVLAICCMVVVSLLALTLFGMVAGIVILLTGGAWTDVTAVFNPDETKLASFLTPVMIAYMIVGSVFTAMSYAVVAAPGAWAYRELTGRGEASPAPAAEI